MTRTTLFALLFVTILLGACGALLFALKGELATSRQEVQALTQRLASLEGARGEIESVRSDIAGERVRTAQLEERLTALRDQFSKFALPAEFGDLKVKALSVIGDDAKPKIVLAVNQRGSGECTITAAAPSEATARLTSAHFSLERAASSVSLGLDQIQMSASGVTAFSVVTKQNGTAYLQLNRANGTTALYPQ
jgi:hypothetical protein